MKSINLFDPDRNKDIVSRIEIIGLCPVLKLNLSVYLALFMFLI